MIITDYYKFKRIATKSKQRMDCTASTESYPVFEDSRVTRENKGTEKRDATALGDLIIYFIDVPDDFGGNIHKKADKSIILKGKNLSSVYVPNPNSNLGYGDARGTADAILFVFNDLEVVNGIVKNGSVIEIFIARGKSKDRILLYHLLTNGELDEEIEQLREKATKMVAKAQKEE